MRPTSRRLVLGGAIAFIFGAMHGRGVVPRPVSAARFDISPSQFKQDCTGLGGQFADWDDGSYTCFFAGWRMECSKVTGQCRIVCDPGVRCVKAKRRSAGRQRR